MCTGYYRYDEGYTPSFEGRERFGGQIVHPQHWPEDLDYAGKRVVVIGSGATAVTLVPAMAEQAAHVTMLQRSPSYVVSLPGTDPLADLLRRVLPAQRRLRDRALEERAAARPASSRPSRRWPKLDEGLIRSGASSAAPGGLRRRHPLHAALQPVGPAPLPRAGRRPVRVDQRGKASVVTDQIETFTENGLRLESGEELEADMIVTATGLNMLLLGGHAARGGRPRVELSETVGYKGMMFSGVPNLAVALGYTNASWTLKCDLVAEYVCRLLNHMDAARLPPVHAARSRDRRWPPSRSSTSPPATCCARSTSCRKQGSRAPWRLHQNYARDILMLRRGPLEDEGIEFSNPRASAEPAERFAA